MYVFLQKTIHVRLGLLIAFACTFLAIGGSARAVSQNVNITITPDFKANGLWSLPADTKGVNAYGFNEKLENFGATGVTSYRFRSAANDKGPLTTTDEASTIIVPNTYTSDSGIKNLYITYDITTALTKPVALYEFWVAGGGYFFSPKVTITYPRGWKVLSVWPSATVTDQSISITYPTDTAYVSPVLVAFTPTDIGSGNTIKTVGRYTLIGPVASVAKLEAAVSGMAFLDDVLATSLGIKAPEKIVVYAADLTSVDVGYEAEALAAKPNVVLYNKEFLDKQALWEVKSILAHEVAHLAEMDQRLFKGATYIAPWFKEGVAVFVENQARPYIFSNAKEQSLADLTNRTHMFGAKELKNRYDRPFDYLFEGGVGSPVYDAYTHSGVLLADFYTRLGVDGMVKLFSVLKGKDASQVNPLHDSDVLVSTLASFTKLPADEQMFPHKNSKNFEQDVIALVHPEYSGADTDALVQYIQQSVPKYLDGAVTSGASPTPITAPSLAPSPLPASSPRAVTSVAGACVLTRTLVLGARDSATGGEVSKLQTFLVKAGHLNADLVTGYFGNMTQAAVRAWQSASGIVSSGTPATTGFGAIGPKSRAALASQCGK